MEDSIIEDPMTKNQRIYVKIFQNFILKNQRFFSIILKKGYHLNKTLK